MKSPRILVCGGSGMVGGALRRRLQSAGYRDVLSPARRDLDLTDAASVYQWFMANRPDYVFMAAAKVGGINANNSYRAEFLFDNLAIAANVIDGAHRAGVDRLMFLGSSCIYPRDCPQPIREDYLLTGPLEQTNEPYAIAKIAGLKLAETYSAQYGRRYISVMPTNLYGPGDNYDLQTSHVLPALIRKAHDAKNRGDDIMQLWGTGAPRREFLYVDDLAEACVHLMERDYNGVPVNIGTGKDISIAELAQIVMEVVGFDGKLSFDVSKPDGTPRKLLDVHRLADLGWTASTTLREGIARAYAAAPFYNEQREAAI